MRIEILRSDHSRVEVPNWFTALGVLSLTITMCAVGLLLTDEGRRYSSAIAIVLDIFALLAWYFVIALYLLSGMLLLLTIRPTSTAGVTAAVAAH